MKKLLFLALIVIGPFAISQGMAQKKAVTTKNATESKGYTVMNPGEAITLYKYQHAAHSPKEAEKYAAKYFFTTTTSSSEVLKELNKLNLKKAFSANHAFHDAIDANFNADAELINYDDFHKMYKLNHILQSNSK